MVVDKDLMPTQVRLRKTADNAAIAHHLSAENKANQWG